MINQTTTTYDTEEAKPPADSVEQCEEIYGPEFWKIKDRNGESWSLPKKLAVNLLMKLYWIKKYGGDLVIFIDGWEGTGKSTLARLVAKLIDPTFNADRILYSYEGLQKWYFDEQPWTAAVYDESQEGVDRLDTLKQSNKTFSAMMRQSRQAHKILIMCGPSIYDISSYVAQHRVSVLLHCYMRNEVHPGQFLYYTRDNIRELFVWNKKERSYTQKAVFNSRFPYAKEVVDMERYNLLKKRAWLKFKGNAAIASRPSEEVEEAFIKQCCARYDEIKKKHPRVTYKIIGMLLGITAQKAYKYNKEAKEIAELEAHDLSQLEIDAAAPATDQPPFQAS